MTPVTSKVPATAAPMYTRYIYMNVGLLGDEVVNTVISKFKRSVSNSLFARDFCVGLAHRLFINLFMVFGFKPITCVLDFLIPAKFGKQF